MLLAQGPERVGQSAETAAQPGLRLIRVGNGHQASQRQVGQLANRFDQLVQLCQTASGLAVFVINVDLKADVQGSQTGLAFLAEPAGNFQAVDAVHPRKGSGNLAGLVGLNGADEVPVNVRQIRQRGLFVQRFLQVVFAECGLPRRRGLT